MLAKTAGQITKLASVISIYHLVPNGFIYVIGIGVATIVYKRHFSIVRVSKRQIKQLKRKWVSAEC